MIGPLLSLLLTNGSSLVTLVVPGALLEQSRSILRSCFSHVINKVSFLFFESSVPLLTICNHSLSILCHLKDLEKVATQ